MYYPDGLFSLVRALRMIPVMMSKALEIWGVYDPNISAQLGLACALDLFQSEAGLDVSCRFLESGTTMVDEILQAETRPFAFTQTPVTSLLLHEHGVRTKLVAPLADIAATQQVIIHESCDIEQPQDLAGRHVGMAQGAAILLALKNMAKDCDVDLNSMQFVDLLPQEQLKAFQSGQLDLIASWEPWTTRARALGGRVYFSGSRSEIPGFEGEITWLVNQSCFIVPDEHLAARPDLVRQLLHVFHKATILLNQHRNKILKPLAQFFKMSPIELLIAMQKNHYSLTVTNLFRLGILSFRDFLYETHQISSRFSEKMLYDVSLLQQVDRSLVFLEETAAPAVAISENNGIYYREDWASALPRMPLKFLLADDSTYVRTLLAKVVKQLGGRVIGEATSGSEILEKFAHVRPDVITMDLSMPGVSGVDAIKIILQSDPDVTILVISGTDVREVREELFQLGVKMFIPKPFNPAHLTTIFANVLSLSTSRSD